MAKASKVTIVEVAQYYIALFKSEKIKVYCHQAEEVVDAGKLDPNDIHLSGIYVDIVIKGTKFQKKIQVCVLTFWYTVPAKYAVFTGFHVFRVNFRLIT